MSMRENDNSTSSARSGFADGGGGGTVVAPTFIAPSGQGGYGYSVPMMPGFANYNGGGFGYGGGIGVEALLLAGLIGGNGFGNRDRCCDDNGNLATGVFGATVLGKLGDVESAIPLVGSQTQNAILEQTASITSQINQVGLAQLAATSNVKDTVQNGVTGILLNANSNTQSVLNAICDLSSKIDQNRISELETQLAEVRNIGRSRDVEINVTQSVNQIQAQAQQQLQTQNNFDQLFRLFNHLAGDIQAVKQGQVIFNSGTMAASGNQSATETQIR